ncbi:porin [Pseudomonadota bacterium]
MNISKLLAPTVMLLAAAFLTATVSAGPKWEYDDDSWMKLDLLGQFHYSSLDGAVDEDDFYMRRFRILVNGQIMDGANVFFQTDYSNAGKQGVDPDFTLLDGWVDLQLFSSDHWIKGGLVPLPFSFENSSSVGALLGLDYNTETLKITNDSTWRDVGLAIHGKFGNRIAYRAGVFDGYENDDTNPDADLRVTGRIDIAVVGDVPTGWFYVQDTLASSNYLTLGGGYDRQKGATLNASIPVDSEAWVLDFRSGHKVGDTTHLTVNGAWYDWDSSEFMGSTAFIEAGLRINKTIGTLKYTLEDSDVDASLSNYTAGLHYNLKGNNIKGGVEYRWGDSADWLLLGVQFLL